MQRAPDAPGNELLWVSVGGLGGGHTLTSQSTNQRGLVTSIDLAPTILRHLGRRVPDEMRGKPIELDGSFDGAYLRSFKARLLVIYARRLPALLCLLGAWALLMLAALALRRRAGPRVGGARGRAGAAVDAGGGARPGGVRARPRASNTRCSCCSASASRALTDRLLAVAPRPARARGRGGRGDHRRRARRHAAARALAARAQPGARRALLRDRQRAQVGPRRARLRRRGRRAVSGGAGTAGGEHDGRVRDRARGDRGLGADRRGRRRRDPRERRHGRRHRAAAAGPRHAPPRADRADQPRRRAWWCSRRSTSPPRTAPATTPAASSTPTRPAKSATSSSAATPPPTTSSSTARCRSRPRSRWSSPRSPCATTGACSRPSTATPGWLAALAGGLTAGADRRPLRGLRPGAARGRRRRPRLRAQLSVGPAGGRGGHAAQSRHEPCSTISCSDTFSGTRSLSVSIALSSALSEKGITTPHSSQTRWWWCSSCSQTRS